MKQLLKQKKGMTMVELLLSLAILAIVVLPFSGMFVNSSRIGSASQDYMRAVQLAQQLMEEHKNNQFGTITTAYVNAEGAENPVAMVTRAVGNLTAQVFYWDYGSPNVYEAESPGLPASYDIIARLERDIAGVDKDNTVFYYYDNGGSTFGAASESKDVIDTDTSSSDRNIKQIHLERSGADEVTISISKAAGSELSAKVDLKPEGEAYSLKLEFLGDQNGSDMVYRIINESGRTLNVYRVDRLSAEDELLKNRTGIINVRGSVAIMSNIVDRDYVSGKHYRIKVEVRDEDDSLLTELYGISN